ncbi:hypothetical protein BKA66DRAFT_91293 [Pyrenochaeta sp. MPI-SDFR-AT-0127]|nr:hypothetical protein BKA66DRAFT_91293 [Pyrenochaeta sp. MPI-SDFR-AT-0127]
MEVSTIPIPIALALFTSFYILYHLRVRSSQTRWDEETEKRGAQYLEENLSPHARQLRAKLIAALPESVILSETSTRFEQSVNSYWDQKACEAVPSCVVQPRNIQELAQVVELLKIEFDRQSERDESTNDTKEGLFAVRGGGHSPVAGASSINGGVLIDMSLFNEVTPSEDGKSVVIGAGCKWMHVYKVLQTKGLAVAGGRNSAVGVAGLALGGGLSFFSPRYGFVCSNILEYEVVLADGTVTKASESSNRDLWCALKGGSNNFGIVTRFTVRSFPFTDIWSGFLYLPPWQAPKVLTAFYEFVNRVVTNDEGKTYDENAAGPLTCFTYLQQLGIQAIAVNLVHTNPPAHDKKWPTCWRNSAFSNLWRFWSTCQVRSLTSATDEMSVLNPPGRRQEFATTTIKNHKATIEAVHKAYRDAITTIRKHNIKAMSWTPVLQPLLPNWARKGEPNSLGLSSSSNEPLVNVSFTVNWALGKDDFVVLKITRTAIEQIDRFAEEHGTAHQYRYLNYCASWQKPLESYGKENLEFLKGVGKKYDSNGLFQKGCVGGFKLN